MQIGCKRKKIGTLTHPSHSFRKKYFYQKSNGTDLLPTFMEIFHLNSTTMITCKQCGNLIDDTASFCPKCGAPVNPPAQQTGQQYSGQQYNGQTPPPPRYNQANPNTNLQYYTTSDGRKVRIMEMLDACKVYWIKYATFEGRARRAEYWWAYLMTFVLNLVLGWTIIVPIATLVPTIAISVRRLHDLNKSGWYYLLMLVPIVGLIILLVWFCQEGTYGRNQYGDDPKYIITPPPANQL